MCRSYIAERRRVSAEKVHSTSEHDQVRIDLRWFKDSNIISPMAECREASTS